jgi:hypothetical protein
MTIVTVPSTVFEKICNILPQRPVQVITSKTAHRQVPGSLNPILEGDSSHHDPQEDWLLRCVLCHES